MADVRLNMPPDGSPLPDQPHSQNERSMRLPPDDGSPTPGKPHAAQREWFKSLMKRPGKNEARPIQRFPKELRRNDEDKECYQPLAISIGPYHRKKIHLKPMRKWKALYAEQYINSKIKSTTPETFRETFWETFADLYGKVDRVAADARKCYAEDATLDMSDVDFTRMMFLDGCFILQFISIEVSKRDPPKELDLSRTKNSVFLDLFMLENQLPFIILMELEGPEEYNNLVTKMKRFVQNFVWCTPQPEAHSSCCPQPIHRLLHFLRLRSQPETHISPSPEPIHHLLHFLRAYLLGNQNDNMVPAQPETHSCWCPQPIGHLIQFLPGHPSENMSNQRGDEERGDRERGDGELGDGERGDDERGDGERCRWHTFRSVKELNKAGIDFRVSSTSNGFSAVRFRSRRMWRGELELPPIFIHGRTKPILLNLVAYEMCFRDKLTEIKDVTSYISFLDDLIDRPEDVMELRSKGILKNFTGSDQEVADLFNTITGNFTPNPKAYREVCQQIEDQRKDRIKMWFVNWIDTYFKAPWSFISVVAAAIALVLTFIQTYVAVRQFGNLHCLL